MRSRGRQLPGTIVINYQALAAGTFAHDKEEIGAVWLWAPNQECQFVAKSNTITFSLSLSLSLSLSFSLYTSSGAVRLDAVALLIVIISLLRQGRGAKCSLPSTMMPGSLVHCRVGPSHCVCVLDYTRTQSAYKRGPSSTERNQFNLIIIFILELPLSCTP